MCSFISINELLTDSQIEYVNEYSKLRGPDETYCARYNNYTFIHNLLSITGEYTVQPFMDENKEIVCLYNGEIYNFKDYGDYKSDGECLIPLYKKHGISFIKKLDGEYSIVLYDFKNNIIVTATDVFATKPLWVAHKDGRIAFASYESSLKRLGCSNVYKMRANKISVFNFNGEILNQQPVYDFDISNQYKNSYDDWILAYEKSIKKRASNCREKIFIGLSSGYDSMTIAKELINQNIDFKAYSIYARENYDLLEERHDIIPDGELIRLKKSEFDNTKKLLKEKCEEFIYRTRMNRGLMTDDKGAVGMYYICNLARQGGKKILLSGQGADEIYSDYGFNGSKLSSVSGIAGTFPEDLKTCFPWNNFYEGTQVSYLAKEEHVAGIFGIEARYPFLDRDLVQEFFWLNNNLKNKNYKAPLHEYMLRNNVSFDQNIKIGFSCNANLV
tara:strand:+ start:97 stop:1428 length:1332 start_codon:yes stop_codon:yes gene_type:complete